MELPEGKTCAMPRVLLNDWLHALDTQKYKKGVATMKNGIGGYCCLGVLQMVASGDVERIPTGAASGDTPDVTTYRGYPTAEWKEKHKVTFLSQPDNCAPAIPSLDVDMGVSIADLNDDKIGYLTFPQIADFIRLHAVALEDLT